MLKERIHEYTFALTLLFIFGAAGIFVFNTQSPTGYVISTPTPSSPYNGATGISLTPTFSWGTTTGAEWYHLYYRKSTESSWQVKSSLTSTSYTFSSSEVLSSGTKYNWQVRACKPGPDCKTSNIMSFTTKGGEVEEEETVEEVETPTTKPSKCTTYFGDDVCDDSPADCGSYYKSFSMVECDECDTWKDGKLGFDKCVGQEVEEETKCTDSDGGKEPYTKGITTGTNYYSDQLIKEEDLCMLADNPTYENGMFLPGGAIGVKTCTGGDKCYVSEHVCTESYETPKKIVIGSWDIPCPNGCKDGACLTNESVTLPTTKPSKCATYFGDDVCDDSPADCGGSYKSYSIDACDECQTWKDGKPGFECFEETKVEGEGIIDMLHEGFWKTYTINGVDYEVTLDFVDANIAKFTVNGESTSKLSIGSSDALSNGALITVNKIEYEGTALGVKSAEFSLDASNAAEGEPSTTKPSKCTTYFGDDVCDDSPADCGSNYKSYSMAECDECQTYKNGKPGFECFEEAEAVEEIEEEWGVVEGCDSTKITLGKKQSISGVKPVLAEKDLQNILNDGAVSNAKGVAYYNQKLYFEVPNTAYVDYLENDNDVTGNFLYFKSGEQIAKYTLSFTMALKSDIDNSAGTATTTGTYLTDFEDIEITMLGKKYTIVDAKRVGTKGIKLILMSGAVRDTLLEGSTKTYTINGLDYEVTLDFVDSTSAKFTINGDVSTDIPDGGTDKVAGIMLGVSEILYQAYAGGVHATTFFLVAEKMELKDTNIADSFSSNSLKVNDETIDDASVTIRGAKDNYNFWINSISVNMKADDNFYVGVGDKLSYHIDGEPEVLFTQNWDIRLNSYNNGKAIVEIGKLCIQEEVEAEPPTTKPSKCTTYFGDKICDDSPADCGASYKSGTSLVACDECQTYKDGKPGFVKCGGAGYSKPTIVKEYEVIKKDYYFVLGGYTLQYKGADKLTADNAVAKFKRVDTGETLEVVAGSVSGTIKIGGGSYVFTSATDPNFKDYDIKVDLNGDGKIEYYQEEAEAEPSTTKSSKCETYFGDDICDDSPADCGSNYKSYSLAECNECDTIKNGKLGFDNCVGAGTVTQTTSTTSQQASCQNSCGGKSEGDCYCDTACVKWEDCCSDYQEVCGGAGQVSTPPTVASQNNYCNSKSSEGCWCDSVSVQSGYHDFCVDIDTVCGIAKPSGVPAKPGSCKVS